MRTREEEEEEDGDDYENMAPPYKDLPPKPDSLAPPRPPRAGKKMENPPLPCKSPKIKGVNLEHPPIQSSLASYSDGVGFGSGDGGGGVASFGDGKGATFGKGVALEHITPVTHLSQKSRCPGCYQEERLVVYLCLLVVVSLLLGCTGLAVTLIKYQEMVEELKILTFQQMAWQANVTGMAGIAGLKKDIDHIRTYTNQSLVKLRGLLDCTKVTCPEGWLPFEGKCYYFSPTTKSWDEARKFCQENYSHLVIISSFAEQAIHQEDEEALQAVDDGEEVSHDMGSWTHLQDAQEPCAAQDEELRCRFESCPVLLLRSGTLEPHTHTDDGTDGAKETPDESLVQVEPAAGNNGKRGTKRDQRKRTK
ncbi:hypothetical protein GH733_003616 [Mirounga leonina]|nr:hypothetical protein GH733_003616 [Mirounga leonina]